MADEAKVRAGRKGAAIREAKKKAAAESRAVYLEEYNLTVYPEGSVVEHADVRDAPFAPAEAAQEAETWPDHLQPPARAPEVTTPSPAPGTVIPVDKHGVAENGGMPAAPEQRPTTLLGLANWYVAHNGLSEEDALSLAQKKLGQQGPQPPAPQGTPADPNEPEGPDPRLIAEYEQRMQNYVPPVTEETFTVVLPVRFADYVRRSAAILSARRRRDISAEKAIEWMVRQYWQHDEDRLIMSAGSTGPRDTFDPKAGQWHG